MREEEIKKLTREEIDILEDQFNRIDKDKDGLISIEEARLSFQDQLNDMIEMAKMRYSGVELENMKQFFKNSIEAEVSKFMESDIYKRGSISKDEYIKNRAIFKFITRRELRW